MGIRRGVCTLLQRTQQHAWLPSYSCNIASAAGHYAGQLQTPTFAIQLPDRRLFHGATCSADHHDQASSVSTTSRAHPLRLLDAQSRGCASASKPPGEQSSPSKSGSTTEGCNAGEASAGLASAAATAVAMTAATMPPEAIPAAAAALTSVAAAARPLQAAREQQSSRPGSLEATSEAPRAGAGGGEGSSNNDSGSDNGSGGGGCGGGGSSSSSGGRSLPTRGQRDAERRWRDGTGGAMASWTPEDDAALTKDSRFASVSIDMGPIKGSAQHAHPHKSSPRKQAETDISRHIKALVQYRGGPVTVAEFMSEALTNPNAGYYIQRDVFGKGGDFITSPEVSQLFGEMIGIWAVTIWQSMGMPSEFRLVELGPGRGTLMADALRGTAPIKQFTSALSIHLVEVSPTLREKQWAALKCEGWDALRDAGPVDAGMLPDAALCGHNGAQVKWHRSLDEISADGPPTVYISNEFFDALPIHQLQRGPKGRWRERLVDVAGNDDERHLRFVLAPKGTPAASVLSPGARNAPKAAQSVEISPQSAGLAENLGSRVQASGGAALVVDYGNAWPAEDSLRGIKDHAFVHPLDSPGECDLSADVDFSNIRRAAEGAGAAVYGPIPQADFLAALGIGVRLESLLKGCGALDNQRARDLAAGYSRLMGTEEGPAVVKLDGQDAGIPAGGGMGYSYKVMAITSAGLPQPVAFEAAPASAAAAAGGQKAATATSAKPTAATPQPKTFGSKKAASKARAAKAAAAAAGGGSAHVHDVRCNHAHHSRDDGTSSSNTSSSSSSSSGGSGGGTTEASRRDAAPNEGITPPEQSGDVSDDNSSGGSSSSSSSSSDDESGTVADSSSSSDEDEPRPISVTPGETPQADLSQDPTHPRVRR